MEKQLIFKVNLKPVIKRSEVTFQKVGYNVSKDHKQRF